MRAAGAPPQVPEQGIRDCSRGLQSIHANSRMAAAAKLQEYCRGPRLGDAASLCVLGRRRRATGRGAAHHPTAENSSPRQRPRWIERHAGIAVEPLPAPAQVELCAGAGVVERGGGHPQALPHEARRGLLAGDPAHRPAAGQAGAAAGGPDAAAAGPAVALRCGRPQGRTTHNAALCDSLPNRRKVACLRALPFVQPTRACSWTLTASASTTPSAPTCSARPGSSSTRAPPPRLSSRTHGGGR